MLPMPSVPIEFDELGRPDGYHIRRRAVEAGGPLLTDLKLARAVIEAWRLHRTPDLGTRSWAEYQARRPVGLK